jgi:RNA polymerase sigma-70 factor (ECF subfamily)
MGTCPDIPNDEDLVRAAQAGDSIAFENLVTRYEKRMFHFFRYRTHCDADAQDLTQQLFVKVYRGLSRFNPDRKLAPWLFSIASRCAVSHYRAQSAQNRLPVTEEEPIDTRTPDTILVGLEAAHNLWGWARSELTPSQFTVMWLRIQEDMSIKDVANATRHTSANVKVMLHRARRRLRRAWSAPSPQSYARGQKATRSNMPLEPPIWPTNAQWEGEVR